MKKIMLALPLIATLAFSMNLHTMFEKSKEATKGAATSAIQKGAMLQSGLKHFTFDSYYADTKSGLMCVNTDKDQYCVLIADGAKWKRYYTAHIQPDMIEFEGKDTRIIVTKAGSQVTNSKAAMFGGQ
jgi:hypothetical protein